MSTELPTQFDPKKDEMLDLIKKALKTLGLDDFHLGSIHLNARRGRVCPPGTTEVFEVVHHPDGSVSYQSVCK